MPCFYPVRAYWRSCHRDAITFDKNKSASKVPFSLPCGRCIGCRMEKARQWGVRCLHEAKMWPQNSYVTLTYNDECLPEGESLCLRDVQLFMKRLRKARKSGKDNPLRFFLGGEYGESNGRPHYHALLFNCGFGDRLFHTYNKRGEPLYVSSELASLWGLGHCTIGEVTFDSAVYCAKYALKKVTGDQALAHYEFIDLDGVVHEKRAEFAVMSRKPGIGDGYFRKYGAEVAAHDNVIVSGLEAKPPRFYDDRCKLLHLSEYEINKRARKRCAVLNRLDNTPARLRVKERIAILAAQKKERDL